MLKKLLLTGIALSLTACISIEAPEHLVADTIEAGKEVYHSVKDHMSDKQPEGKKTFTHKYLVPEGELIGESSGKCIELAINTARKSLNIYNIEIQSSHINSKTSNSQSFIECSIVVDHNG